MYASTKPRLVNDLAIMKVRIGSIYRPYFDFLKNFIGTSAQILKKKLITKSMQYLA